MYDRILKDKLIQLFSKFPVLAILGPRQSGKTTLAQSTFPNFPYVNLEDLTFRDFAIKDPKGFIESFPDRIIIDEIQYAPNLLSYIQLYSDQKNKPGLYVITGSQQFLLNEKISQSLAGRAAITTLLPLSIKELKPKDNIWDIAQKGFYPRLHNYNIEPKDFYPSYIQTYIERDVRQIKNITDLPNFHKFVTLCAARIGQVLNLSALANECGISSVTAKSWLSLLEMSFIVYCLQPFYENYNKRLVKSPKLYFYDTGIVCSLLNIYNSSQLENSYLKGSIFENMIVADIMKQYYNRGENPNLYYFRDKSGHEIDLIIEQHGQVIPIEIKSGKTVSSDYFKNINYWNNLTGNNESYIIYNGNDSIVQRGCRALHWRHVEF